MVRYLVSGKNFTQHIGDFQSVSAGRSFFAEYHGKTKASKLHFTRL